MRIGMGYDVHRLAENRKMIIGGVEIPYEKGLLGHSDADVAAARRLWMPCSEQQHWAISESISRTQIRRMKAFPV